MQAIDTTQYSRFAVRRLLTCVAAGVMLSVGWPNVAFGADEQKEEKKVEVEDVETEDKPEVEKKGAAELEAEKFIEEKNFQSLKRRDEQIVQLKELVRTTRKSDPERAEFLFNLAEMYWKKSKYYENQAFSKQDECYKLREAGKTGKADRCKRQMEQMLDESKKLRKKAVEKYRAVTNQYPEYEKLDKVYFFLGTNLMETGRQKEAMDVYRQLISEFPKTRYVPNVLLAFGEYYFDNKKVKEALKAYKKIREYPKSSVYTYARYKEGWCQFNLEQKRRALQSFVEVVELLRKREDEPEKHPLMDRVQRDVVRVYSHVGQPGKAIAFLKDLSNDKRQVWLDLAERLAVYYSDNGKTNDAIAMYRELLRKNADSLETIDYQYEIVRNQLVENTYRESTIESVVRLLNLTDRDKAKKLKGFSEDKYREKREKVEKLARKWATTFHREAQKTKNERIYEMAQILYENYLQTFPESERRYKMTFFHGELLYHLEKWKKAARVYKKTFNLKPKGKYTEDAVRGEVLAYFNLVKTSEKRAQLGEDVAKDDDSGRPEKKSLPEVQKGLVDACRRYIEHRSQGKRIVDVKYTLARTYYDFNHLNRAIRWFKQIAYKHSDHRLAVIAANLHLDSLNLLERIDDLHSAATHYLEKRPIEDEEFISQVRDLLKSIAFKRCNAKEDREEWRKAGRCFVDYAKQFPESELVAKALYNAALDYERVNELGKAIEARLRLLKARPNTELGADTLYSIAGNYHALAVYSRAARYYELFVQNFPEDDRAREAIANAATFRQGLGQYQKAIRNYRRYLELFGKQKREKTAEITYQIAKIYEQQDRSDKAHDQYKKYIETYGDTADLNRFLQAHLQMGLYQWNRHKDKRRDRAIERFERVLTLYDKRVKGKDKQKYKMARDAAAHAKFMLGKDVFERMAAIEVSSSGEEELKQKIGKKMEVAEKAQATFEEVIKFGRPGWAIAALFKIGALYENFANTIRDSPPPERLSYKQKEIYRGILEDKASLMEKKAVDAYVKAVNTSTEKSWFNEYSDKAKIRLGELRPREYRKPSEIAAQPRHLETGFNGVDLLSLGKQASKQVDSEQKRADRDSESSDGES